MPELSTPRRDVLATWLLVATLLLTLSMRAFRWMSVGYDAATEARYVPAAFPLCDMLAWTLAAVLVRSVLYYGVRRGVLAAKLLLLGVCIHNVYSSTAGRDGFVAGMDLAYPTGWLLLPLAENLLTLAALVLMFSRSRPAVVPT